MSEQDHSQFSSEQLSEVDSYIDDLLLQMTLSEKVGQMSQCSGVGGFLPNELVEDIQGGKVGSVINEVNLDVVNEMQRIAVEESRLGIPLLIGRDVIHGFKTIFPIPLGQAASWSPEVVKLGAKISAMESASVGVNWTFAPMIDISRDPRWGRVAESLGEDPYLCSELGKAMITGFQGDSLSAPGAIAACAKHFAGYGAAESGRDYNTVNLSEHELRNVYLPPFKAAAQAGVATFMSAFNELNGIPASGNEWLMKQVLREEWGYDGFVVSDWESIKQLTIHGFCEDEKMAAFEAINAGIDMEMVSRSYQQHLEALIDEGKLELAQIDIMVRRILTLKYELGLFDNPFTDPKTLPTLLNPSHLLAAKEAAIKSCVLLKNSENKLPLDKHQLQSIAVIGPLADDGYEQLGTWIFDGEAEHSTSCLAALKDYVGSEVEIKFAQGLETSRSEQQAGFDEAVNLAHESDLVLMFLGEESILSGEAHCRSNINLPGAQEQLIEAVAATGKSIVLVVMAGRPLTLTNVIDKVDAVLYAWHPGTMGGPAITELLFGIKAPSGKLPISFPRVVGQIPLYYSQKHTGKPATDESFVHMKDIPQRAQQTSLGMAATHLDTHFTPLFPFGFGLSYSECHYRDIEVSHTAIAMGGTVTITAQVSNVGKRECEEVVQLYVRDLVANVTRPVKELKGFQRISLMAGESQVVSFSLHTDDVAFYDRNMVLKAEPGLFDVWIGGDSDTRLRSQFSIKGDDM
ncbi:beta-glucosidase BglX [Shewanella woodyi]|uniref:beta-glucosidase n=1 Tax=Shewanella woodyi (strain ATCC 51908 / MS32) TaxID=392500 RepID=B1KJE7_SHEWM|nr:beta-glucosidase BglX [Shewanella woodyi]ACA88619.1 glycoside hydrolase family 3 domain protein [Shewanella woodyi ATCC 51908]